MPHCAGKRFKRLCGVLHHDLTSVIHRNDLNKWARDIRIVRQYSKKYVLSSRWAIPGVLFVVPERLTGYKIIKAESREVKVLEGMNHEELQK